jgi:hypothetical protein
MKKLKRVRREISGSCLYDKQREEAPSEGGATFIYIIHSVRQCIF